MKLTGLFKRGAACLCTAAILMGGGLPTFKKWTYYEKY